ncbi:MAG: hypothetical protein IPG94_25975 [Kineosporiaceae bacterium]|nr:hypothetical protein [Kineosporiaceae bacterium]
MPTFTALAIPALAAALVAGPITVAAADSAPSGSATPAPSEANVMSRTCARIETRITRVERATARLAGDAETKGSIARAQARLAAARAAGHADAARLLENRVAIRQDLAAALPDILARLKDSREVCTK